MRKICIVSEECNGVANAGGIGACVRGLAQWLAANGAAVDLLITSLSEPAADRSGEALRFADLYFLTEAAKSYKDLNPPNDETSKSYHVYRFLKDRDYDEVHFNDWLGTGFYTAMARRQGRFGGIVVTHLHGSAQWVRAHNLNPPEIEDLVVEAVERSQIENSDLVISPSRYLIDWYRHEGVQLPQALQRNWILPQWSEPGYAAADAPLRALAIPAGALDEIVFFGRHERRKGFQVFVEAIARLPASLSPDVTFIGRFDRLAREHTGGFALRKLRNYAGRLRFLHDLKQPEALDYLRRRRRALAVMPSLIENSPCVVGECFTLNVPFLAGDVGGAAELVAEQSRPHCLVEPQAAALAAAIERVLTQGMPELVSTLNPHQARRAWLAPATARPVETPADKPLVSVCFVHYERPHLLRRAYDAVRAQTYDNIEIVIVDDGSRSPGAHACLDEIEATPGRFPVTVIRGPNQYLGAARNAGARAAKGEWLLFHDDDNLAEPDEVETLVTGALAYGADVMTAQCYVFHDGEQGRDGPARRIEFYPLGIGGAFSFFQNRFGDANALVRRATFEEIGGFTEARGVGFEDWEFFLKAFLRGKRLAVAPEPLFNYRASATGMLGSGNLLMDYERIYRAVEEFRPRLGADVIRIATRAHLSQMVLDRTWNALAREPGADLLQQLTSFEPNSAPAIVRLSDLALHYGRLADAVEIGAKAMEGREVMAQLLRDPALARRMRKPFEIVALEPAPAEDAVYVEGWAVDGAGAPLDPPAIWVAGRWLTAASAIREPRADVRQSLRLASERDLGFRLFAFVAADAANSEARERGRFGRSLREGLKPRGPALHKGPAFDLGDFACALPAGEGWRGHIDRGGWQRATKIDLPEGYDHLPIVEIETTRPANTAVVWSDGAFDWGRKVSATRTRFAREGSAGRTVTVIAPSRVRTHVVVS